MERLKRFFGFLSFGYEPDGKVVVVTLRLNAAFIQGAVLAAFLFTLVFKYGGISLGSVFQLLRDLLQGGLWIWVLVAIGLALFAMRKGTGVEAGGLKSRIASLIPQGIRGTATLCVILVVLLLIVTWCFPTSTPQTSEPGLQSQGPRTVPEVQSRGLETPSIWHEVQKGPRK